MRVPSSSLESANTGSKIAATPQEVGGCLGGLSCFRKQKGGKRIVPASRIPDGNAVSNQPNGPQAVGLPNLTTGIAPSLFAPPSSPASFSHSALHPQLSHQAVSCLPIPLEAHHLISPLTPPPELAHLTTPSSPDVPYAHFLLSSANIKTTDKTSYIAGNDLQATYSLYPGSPASTLRSPVSRTSGDCLSSSFTERDFPPQWNPSIPSQESATTKSESGRFLGLEETGASKSRQDSNFFCPETFAQFYLDQSSFSHSGGRLSISKESDAYSNGGNVHQTRQSKICKPDAEELEAYRASFGFSADEIITTTHYVEISDVLEDSFSMTPLTSDKSAGEEHILTAPTKEELEQELGKRIFLLHSLVKYRTYHFLFILRILLPAQGDEICFFNGIPEQVPQKRFENVPGRSFPSNDMLSDDDDIFTKMGTRRIGRKYHFGSSNSDAEIEYRRGRSLREERRRES
ncbi:UNVERIFIED_CONTAM: hypothetical protein Scaly_1637100 [Sesamum calycinum]|uniref:Hydroxyproline-rich glycoprotein family protein n=1 Tax=Sesamum calycinum TaxID=2727403 RepID=A0AAW2P9I8_9LAMI